ncbi:hypothetical protein CIPAW_04G191200 [Carya illinoinensis]|uniref:Uncharacterized protein n=1 Tax=Carya illinoinensis TaxID=32201 RepID=A0A8T1QUX1_CARIL|nr:hypothetical protein CIPAW_04G191200 [Carya illinoinensis]
MFMRFWLSVKCINSFESIYTHCSGDKFIFSRFGYS